VRRFALVVVAAAVCGIAAGVAIAALDRHAATLRLPELHGQATWPAGARPAPARGLPSLRGHTSVVTFMDPRCTSICPIEGRQLASILRRLPAASRPTLVLVSVNPQASAADAVRASRKWQLAPFHPHWVLGSHATLSTVWSAYHVQVRPTKGDIMHTLVAYLVDRHGDERTAYLFPFAPAFVQDDLARLAAERT
jgi:cytochrome oxidase Cu insertion factor (SCO1/SenC/PrrC family)